jgi:hypothetical protein
MRKCYFNAESPKRMRPQLHFVALRSVALVLLMAACGGPSTPTPLPEPPLVLHDKLNPPGGTSNIQVPPVSSQRGGGFETAVVDDFVSPATTEIRAVQWQGIYVPPRQAGATRFELAFLPDNGVGTSPLPHADPATPGRTVSLYRAFFSIADVNERLDVFVTCANSTVQCGFYDYSVTLPTPFAVTKGVRYWLFIQAEVPFTFDFNARVNWAWRIGLPDNQRASSSIANATLLTDFAFALRR